MIYIIFQYQFSNMEVSWNGGTPKNGWSIREHPILKWMIGGYPYFRKPPYIVYLLHTTFFPFFSRWNPPLRHLRKSLQARFGPGSASSTPALCSLDALDGDFPGRHGGFVSPPPPGGLPSLSFPWYLSGVFSSFVRGLLLNCCFYSFCGLWSKGVIIYKYTYIYIHIYIYMYINIYIYNIILYLLCGFLF